MKCEKCGQTVVLKKTWARKEQDVAAVRKLVERRMPIREACKLIGISTDSYYKWNEMIRTRQVQG